ncbi:glycoside hydrolase family 115 protein, partial [Aureobasidium melanogenum]
MISIRPLLSLLSLASTALAIGQNATIAFNASAGSHELASAGSSVQIMADTHDWPAVLKAAHDLSQDFGRVIGTNGSVILSNTSDTSGVPAYNAGSYFSSNPNNASMIFNITNLTTFSTTGSGAKGGAIIAGTIGNSSLIDMLIKSGKIDVSAINGTWEAFTSTVVSNPMDGVAEALVIAGSDRRGTVYGLYDVSEQIG